MKTEFQFKLVVAVVALAMGCCRGNMIDLPEAEIVVDRDDLTGNTIGNDPRPSGIAFRGEEMFIADYNRNFCQGAVVTMDKVNKMTLGDLEMFQVQPFLQGKNEVQLVSPFKVAFAGSSLLVVEGAGGGTEACGMSGVRVRKVSLKTGETEMRLDEFNNKAFENLQDVCVHGKKAYITDHDRKIVVEWDLKSGKARLFADMGKVGKPSGCEVADGSLFIGTNEGISSSVVKFDLNDDLPATKVGTFDGPDCPGLGLAMHGSSLYVMCTNWPKNSFIRRFNVNDASYVDFKPSPTIAYGTNIKVHAGNLYYVDFSPRDRRKRAVYRVPLPEPDAASLLEILQAKIKFKGPGPSQ